MGKISLFNRFFKSLLIDSKSSNNNRYMIHLTKEIVNEIMP